MFAFILIALALILGGVSVSYFVVARPAIKRHAAQTVLLVDPYRTGFTVTTSRGGRHVATRRLVRAH